MSNQKLKSSRSAGKRFKISARGKIKRRRTRQNHFNAKNSGNERRDKRMTRELPKASHKDIEHLLPYSL